MKKALVLLVLLAGCPSDDDSNPSTLWLAPDQNETHVKLIDHEPPPF
jgi:hypothetical protein